MADEAGAAFELVEQLLAKVTALQRTLGIMMRVQCEASQESETKMIGALDAFARGARRENAHRIEIEVYEDTAEWLRRLAATRPRGDPPTSR